MNATQFLKFGGLVLIVVGILGFIGILGPTADRSIFGPSWWFDNKENWAHLLLGIVAIILGYWSPKSIQRPVTMIVGIVGVLIGLYSIFNQQFLGANLENPTDTLLHILVGIWALTSVRGKAT